MTDPGKTAHLALRLDRQAATPLHRQLYAALSEAIRAGSLPPGGQLPASRDLAAELGVARVVVTQAYGRLEAEGYIVSRVGAGTFVAPDLALSLRTTSDDDVVAYEPHLTDIAGRSMALAAAAGPVAEAGRGDIDIDFGFGRSFAQLFPYDVWRRLLARYLSTDDAMLARYGSPAGYYPLRGAVAGYLGRARGVNCVPEQVVIVSGAQQALDILARLLLRPGDEVLVETPGYPDAYTLFRLHGLSLTGLQVDDDGLPVDAIPAGRRARLVFVTPAHQFPRGGAMPLGRRLALLDWSRRHDTLIIEDDYDGDLRYDGYSLNALQSLDSSGHVVYLGTFSKVLFPALRLGYLVLPRPLLDPFIDMKALVDRGAPTLTQAAVADFIGEGHFERHLRRLRAVYGARRQVLVDSLQAHLAGAVEFSPVAAGLHIMLMLGSDVEEQTVVDAAAAAGVRVYGGASYFLEQPAPPSILLGFSGLEEASIREGVRRLAEVIA